MIAVNICIKKLYFSGIFYLFCRRLFKISYKNLLFDFKSLPLQKTSEIFSCLFVKFVLYTAGVLGEGLLLFLNIQ